ncbi:nitrate- and nitrite sensing domain-containing protein [Streptomyces thermocarboxydovorans]|uniref:histidine kinase n=1 Tax=Streptomyces thermocarboxydovorans TaxID=59298 RepID=A0ABN1HFS4_9ACTN
MQKTRPRGTGKQTTPTGGTEQKPTVGRGRPTHVRNRLIVAVAVVAAAIAGAGTPSLLTASAQLGDAQELVTLSEQTRNALTLAHSLADERDEVTSFIAAGRPRSKAPSEQHSARVDRQVDELRADSDTTDELRDDLDAIAAVRRAALTGKSGALEAHQAYSTAINELHRLAERLAEKTPPRAGSGAHALAELDSAVQQAAATRGLLLAALSVPRSTTTVIDPVTGLPTTSTGSGSADTKRRDALTAAAVQARLRSDAALADFRETAPKSARTSYDSTVTGPEVNSAETYLARLTDQPALSESELGTDPKKLRAALTARIDLMRGVESALYEQRSKELAQLRDDDVTALEIRVAVLGALMLLAVGIATAMARTLTRPLSVLRRGTARLAEAEDPASQEPVAFTGRNDEFAQVVRSVNALHAHAAQLAERIATLETDRKHLIGQRQKMADAREELRAELADATARLERHRAAIGGTFVNLALRTLGLVERQLSVIEGLEEREQDPDRLSTLFKLDHFATVMRRHSENLLVLAGAEHGQQTAGPVPLVDVARAAVSEIERYERVRIAALPPHAHIVGFAADDLSHLLAELLENATSFSPPDLPVEVSGWLLENGEVMLSVQDEGIGMTAERLERLNARLCDFDPEAGYDAEGEDGLGLGLYVVARLAQRHGVRVQLRAQKQGGVAAVVVLPNALLADDKAAVPSSAPVQGAHHGVHLPGADAEANSNVLHGRTEQGDRLVALAEKAVRRREAEERQEEAEDATEPAADTAEPAAQQATGGETDDGTSDAGVTGKPGAESGEEPGDGRSEEAQEASSVKDDEAAKPAEDVEKSAAGSADSSESPQPGGEFERLWPEEADRDRLGKPGDHDRSAEHGRNADGEDRGDIDTEPRSDAAGEHVGRAGDEHAESAARSEAGGRAAEPSADAPVQPAETTMELLLPSLTDRPAEASAEPEAQEEERAATAEETGPAATTRTGTGDWTLPGTSAEPSAERTPGDDTASATGAWSAPGDTPRTEQQARPDEPAQPLSGRSGDEQPARAELPTRPVPGTGASDQATRSGLPKRPVADGPEDEHARVPDGSGEEEAVTAKGLPKRTPKITAPVSVPRPRTGGVDAEALRRRLGGFRRGAEAGRRDVEAEIAENTGRHQRPDQTTSTSGTSEEATGGTVEEASS